MGQVGLEGAFASCSAVADAGPWGVEAHLLLHLAGFPWLALEAVSHLMWGCSDPPPAQRFVQFVDSESSVSGLLSGAQIEAMSRVTCCRRKT